MKRDSVSAYVHMRCDIPLPLHKPVHILDDSPSFPQLRKYLDLSTLPPPPQKKRTFEFRIH